MLLIRQDLLSGAPLIVIIALTTLELPACRRWRDFGWLLFQLGPFGAPSHGSFNCSGLSSLQVHPSTAPEDLRFPISSCTRKPANSCITTTFSYQQQQQQHPKQIQKTNMAHHHTEGVINPLRPYYIPPTIGEPAVEPMTAPGPHAFTTQGNATDNYASKARTIFSDIDIDYKEYLTDQSPSVMSTVKEVLDELLWKYMSVFMAQPFEVAKTIMQVRAQDDLGGLEALAMEQAKQKAASSQKIRMYEEVCYWQNITRPSTQLTTNHQDTPSPYDSDSDQDEMASFFTAKVPHRPGSPSKSRSGGRGGPRDPSPGASTSGRTPSKQVPEHQLTMRTPNSVLEVIAQLWQKEGAWGVWKGNNATFIYSVLQSLLENWSRSLLSALFNVPDLGVRGDLDRFVDIASPYPWASLFVAGAAAAITGLILSPLDLVRTRCVLSSPSLTFLQKTTH